MRIISPEILKKIDTPGAIYMESANKEATFMPKENG